MVHILRHVDEVYRYHEFTKKESKEWKRGLFPEINEVYNPNDPSVSRMKKSVKFLLADYQTMIQEILKTAKKVEYRPHQFGGYKFIFADSSSQRQHKVTASVLPDRVSFILTCF